jgi:hypothetical protein
MESVLKGFWSLHGLYEHMLIHANVLDNCFESMLSFLFYSLLFLWVWGGRILNPPPPLCYLKVPLTWPCGYPSRVTRQTQKDQPKNGKDHVSLNKEWKRPKTQKKSIMLTLSGVFASIISSVSNHHIPSLVLNHFLASLLPCFLVYPPFSPLRIQQPPPPPP